MNEQEIESRVFALYNPPNGKIEYRGRFFTKEWLEDNIRTKEKEVAKLNKMK